MKSLLGKKIGMTSIFDEQGNVIPVTVIQAGPCVVTQVKTKEKDGYNAIQIGYEEQKEYKVTKPLLFHFKKHNLKPYKYLREIREDKIENYKIGDEIKVNIFKKNELVNVTGTTKGRGFSGVIKRWGFHGAPASHGSKEVRRKPMSAGDTNPARIIKGKKMPGRYGSEKVTVKNLKIVDIDEEKNLILVKGAIPGYKGGLVIINKK